MKQVKTEDAVGLILCHDVTEIIKDVKKGPVFRKGHVITESDLAVLLNLGKDHVYIMENDETKFHENEAAEVLIGICENEYMYKSEVSEGKIELFSEINGVLSVDTKRLLNINSLGEMVIATRTSGSYIKKGDKICATRIIPLVIDKEKIKAVTGLAGESPLLQIKPILQKKYGLIITGNELFYGRIKDTFTPVITEKMAFYGAQMIASVTLEDNYESITAAIKGMIKSGAEMILCTGGMSVDPDDKTPLAIKNAADEIISYGAPVFPGAMFMLAYTDEGIPICGLPGCVMYSKRTVFDIVLPKLLADIKIETKWLSSLGNGGLCLECQNCSFPNCRFSVCG